MNDDIPWWWPKRIDEAYLRDLREDYPEKANMSDEELLGYFQDGRSKGQFSHYWDNLGDAYEDYAALANAFLFLVSKYGVAPKDFKK